MGDRWVLRMILGFVGWGGIVLAMLAGLAVGFGAAGETLENYRSVFEEWAPLPALVWGAILGFAAFVALGAAPAMLCLALLAEDHLHELRTQAKRLRAIEDHVYRIELASRKSTH